jgi:uncharacterized Zn-finger protein
MRALPFELPAMLPSDATAQKAANTERVYTVHRADLPLSCPTPDMRLWNSHPRVYLPIEDEGGTSICPYCGAKYVLAD